VKAKFQDWQTKPLVHNPPDRAIVPEHILFSAIEKI